MLQTASQEHRGPSCGNETATQPFGLVCNPALQLADRAANKFNEDLILKEELSTASEFGAGSSTLVSFLRSLCSAVFYFYFFGGGGEFSSLNKSGECRILSLMSISLFQPLTDSYPFFFFHVSLSPLWTETLFLWSISKQSLDTRKFHLGRLHCVYILLYYLFIKKFWVRWVLVGAGRLSLVGVYVPL